MSTTVCLFSAGTLGYPQGGGYLWIFLNWALGFRSLGCRMVWLEGVPRTMTAEQIQERAAMQKRRLEPFGLADCLALCSWSGEPLPPGATDGCLDLDAAAEADLLLNQRYGAPPAFVGRFRRTALLDIDPGLLQTWISKGWLAVAPHDTYFTISDRVGQPGARIPDVGLRWQHAPPCVALDWWQPHRPAADSAFTTLTHWYATAGTQETGEESADDKRSGFLPFLDLPRRTSQPLELALDVAACDRATRAELEERGWRVRDAYAVTSTAADFQRYVQGSLGEFSCAKPSYVRLDSAWLSDRTVCYLASGKPAVVQHTGPSRILPDAAGLFRFRDLEEAACYLEAVAADYEHQSRLARALAEEYFDARKVARGVLEVALA